MSQRSLSQFNSDVHIVGASITGLVTALELADQGVKPTISEASGEISGRARQIEYQGHAVNLGPNWFHDADDNSLLKWMRDRYTRPDKMHYDPEGIYQNFSTNFFHDTSSNALTIMPDGIHAGNDLCGEADTKLLQRWVTLSADGHDHALSVVAEGDDLTERYAQFMARNWMGWTDAASCSAAEYFSDESSPGGFIPLRGMGACFAPLGMECAHLGIPIHKTTISSVNAAGEGYKLTGSGKYEFTAKTVLLTCSMPALLRMKFGKPLEETPEVAQYLHDVVPTHLTKIISFYKQAFFEETAAASIKPNTHIRILSFDPPLFAFARPLGAPSVILFTAGNDAVHAERWKPAETREFLRQAFGRVPMLHGFEKYMLGEPLVTKHATIPRFGASFSALRIGGKRSGKVLEHTPGLFIANADTAGLDEGAATMMGAHRMGMKSAAAIKAYFVCLRP